MKIFKRSASAFAAAAMLASTAAIPAVNADDALPQDSIFELSFDESGTGSGSYAASSGGSVTEYGSVAYEDSFDGTKALSISTNAAGNYLELPKGLFSGKEAITVSFDIKPQSQWAFFTTPVSGSQVYLSEKYLGMLMSGSGFTSERYNNSGARLSSITSSGSYDEWTHVDAVFTPNASKMYVNGTLSAWDDAAVDIASLFTADASTWIGHANWGAGEGFAGRMDNFRVYGREITADEAAALAKPVISYVNQSNIAQYNRYFIDMQFTDSAGKKIFAAKEGESARAKLSIKNYKISDTSFTFTYVVGNTDNIRYVNQTEPLAVASGAEVSYEFDVPAGAQIVAAAADGSTYRLGTLPVSDAEFPTAQVYANENDDPTFGAHDPTIFKDPAGGHYWAYSSHNLVFESEDLINWIKHDYTKTYTVPSDAKAFIEANYSNTTANGTYWAPDLIYKPEDEYPYWFYLSTSCGLGGMNSVISLVKAKSPGLWDGETQEGGVVIASKDGTNFNTNCIDANIYTDENGNTYFIWGSFWKGIHGAKLLDNGMVEGIDYSSTSSILAQKFGTRLFSTPNGVMGPEGPFTFRNEDNGYTYLMTSYGWLGTNYNARLARTSKSMTDVMTGANPHRQFLDQKGREVGKTYTEQNDKSTPWGYKLIGSYNLGGITYYGNGHNSAMKDDDGNWYYVQHCRKVPDAAAYLQVRKMLWTESGWPVVSPMVYSGEKEQTLPKEIVYGTWNLCSVGHTIMDGCTSVSDSAAYRGADAPVYSAEITLTPDGRIAGGKGTWEFDGGHKVKLTFTADGDESSNEFYKSGDTMEMFVLAGFDEDENGGEKALVMTGIDDEGTAQFAKKMSQTAEDLEAKSAEQTEAIALEKSTGGNPIVRADNTGKLLYGGDPSVLVDGDTVYLFAGHDTASTEDYVIPEYVCYSSKDLVNWTYEGVPFAVNRATVPWASGDTSAWAGQVLKHNGKYYLYYCTWANSAYSGYQCIGVAVSDTPQGPYTNVSTTPLINGRTMTTENSSSWNDIDPTGWIETDADGNEHIYLNWGNSENYTCELNDDMVSVKGSIVHSTFNNIDGVYTEAPYLYRRTDENGSFTGKYYLFFAKDWREQWAYATNDDIMDGTWDYENLMMTANATSNTSHGAVFDFNGKTYFIYHNGALPHGSGFRRSPNVQEVIFNADGTIDTMEELSTGIAGTASTITTFDGRYVGHEHFDNPLSNDAYPIKKTVTAGDENGTDTQWEIVAGKADADNDTYVSLQSVNKPGLYIKAEGTNAYLTQDADGSAATALAMTFVSRKALNGDEDGVSFESASKPGYYLTYLNNKLILTTGSMADNCSFRIGKADEPASEPTAAPTAEPTQEPTEAPTAAPTQAPAGKPYISDVTATADNAVFTVNNLDGVTADAVIAEYDTSGRLTNVSVKQVTIEGDSCQISFPTFYPKGDIKAMLWQNNVPLTEAARAER